MRTKESKKKRIKEKRQRIKNGEDAMLKSREKVKITYDEDGNMEVWNPKTFALVGYNLDSWQFLRKPKSMQIETKSPTG